MARPKSDRTLREEATRAARRLQVTIEHTYGRLTANAIGGEALRDLHDAYHASLDLLPIKDDYTAEQREAAAEELSQVAAGLRCYATEATASALGELTMLASPALWYLLVDNHLAISAASLVPLDRGMLLEDLPVIETPAQALSAADALDEAASWILSGWSPGDVWSALDDELKYPQHVADSYQIDGTFAEPPSTPSDDAADGIPEPTGEASASALTAEIVSGDGYVKAASLEPAPAVSATAPVACPLDTDGDGNCPAHSSCASGTAWGVSS